MSAKIAPNDVHLAVCLSACLSMFIYLYLSTSLLYLYYLYIHICIQIYQYHLLYIYFYHLSTFPLSEILGLSIIIFRNYPFPLHPFIKYNDHYHGIIKEYLRNFKAVKLYMEADMQKQYQKMFTRIL